MGALIFIWNATRGHRLRPWRSPYLRWRLETYSGLHAERISLGDFVRIVGSDWRQFVRFLRWTGELRRDANAGNRD